MIDQTILSAALKCFKQKIPFALYSLPDSEKFVFFANPSFPDCQKQSNRQFLVSPWLCEFANSIRLHDEMTANEILLFDFDSYNDVREPSTVTTEQTEYVSMVASVISRLQHRGGKTVISRTFVGNSNELNLEKFIELQFNSFPSTFRYVFFTPETNLWIGTTPEILLEADKTTGEFKIMSLAGTRRIDDAKQPWDNKNIAEQGLVARFIAHTLERNGITFEMTRRKDLEFPPVCHICDMFSGVLNPGKIGELIDDLNPTPAIGGYPRKEAIEDIQIFEKHERRCYGGFVGVETNRRLTTYVNLRCINISENSYCAYAGGGITASSNPGSEWAETINKTEVLRKNLEESKDAAVNENVLLKVY